MSPARQVRLRQTSRRTFTSTRASRTLLYVCGNGVLTFCRPNLPTPRRSLLPTLFKRTNSGISSSSSTHDSLTTPSFSADDPASPPLSVSSASGVTTPCQFEFASSLNDPVVSAHSVKSTPRGGGAGIGGDARSCADSVSLSAPQTSSPMEASPCLPHKVACNRMVCDKDVPARSDSGRKDHLYPRMPLGDVSNTPSSETQDKAMFAKPFYAFARPTYTASGTYVGPQKPRKNSQASTERPEATDEALADGAVSLSLTESTWLPYNVSADRLASGSPERRPSSTAAPSPGTSCMDALFTASPRPSELRTGQSRDDNDDSLGQMKLQGSLQPAFSFPSSASTGLGAVPTSGSLPTASLASQISKDDMKSFSFNFQPKGDGAHHNRQLSCNNVSSPSLDALPGSASADSPSSNRMASRGRKGPRASKFRRTQSMFYSSSEFFRDVNQGSSDKDAPLSKETGSMVAPQLEKSTNEKTRPGLSVSRLDLQREHVRSMSTLVDISPAHTIGGGIPLLSPNASKSERCANCKTDRHIPCFSVKEDSLMRITKQTLVDLLDGAFSDIVDKITVVDCRFEYEYSGGHIPGAINLHTLDAVSSCMLTSCKPPKPSTSHMIPRSSRHSQQHRYHSEDNRQPPDCNRHIVVFHCEYSQHRAPRLALHLRSMDRKLNSTQYPLLSYPDVFVLHGGYADFYASHSSRCGGGYVAMNDEAYRGLAGREMHTFRRASKFSRTQSYTFGECLPDKSGTRSEVSRDTRPTDLVASPLAQMSSQNRKSLFPSAAGAGTTVTKPVRPTLSRYVGGVPMQRSASSMCADDIHRMQQKTFATSAVPPRSVSRLSPLTQTTSSLRCSSETSLPLKGCGSLPQDNSGSQVDDVHMSDPDDCAKNATDDELTAMFEA